MSNSCNPVDLQPARHLCPWNCLGKNTRVGGQFLLRGIFLTRELKPVSCIAGRFCTEPSGKPLNRYQSVQSLGRVRLFVTPRTAARRPACPSPTPGAHPNPRPLSQGCHPSIPSSVAPFSCPQSALLPYNLHRPHNVPLLTSLHSSRLSAVLDHLLYFAYFPPRLLFKFLKWRHRPALFLDFLPPFSALTIPWLVMHSTKYLTPLLYSATRQN